MHKEFNKYLIIHFVLQATILKQNVSQLNLSKTYNLSNCRVVVFFLNKPQLNLFAWCQL